MARIALIGGHGKIALLLAPLLVERGDTVTAVIRNPDHTPDVEATGASALVSDIETLDRAGWSDLLAGHDAIVWSAGAGGGDARRTYAVDRDAAMLSIDAAADAGVRRYVMVSYFGAGPDHGVDPDDSFFAYAESKAAADEHLRASGLEWTVLGPSRLTAGPATGRIDVAAADGGEVARADVAAVIAAVIAEPGTVGRTIRFNEGETPIADAVASV